MMPSWSKLIGARVVCANAGGRKKPVPKVTIMDLNRRMTGEPKDFQEVMEQARRVSQGGEA